MIFAIYITIGGLIAGTFCMMIAIHPFKDLVFGEMAQEIQEAGLLVTTICVVIMILSWPIIITYIIINS